MGFPAAKNAHAFGNVCYKSEYRNAVTTSRLKPTVAANRERYGRPLLGTAAGCAS